jgi:hypothetical protein
MAFLSQSGLRKTELSALICCEFQVCLTSVPHSGELTILNDQANVALTEVEKGAEVTLLRPFCLDS